MRSARRRGFASLVVAATALVSLLAAACGGAGDEAVTAPGGDAGGSGIDMDADWVQVATPPLSGRFHSAFVSLPDGALVLGGTDDVRCGPDGACAEAPEPPLRDGVRYHAADETWTPIADAPVGVMTWSSRAVVGGRVFFWVPADGKGVVEGSELVAYDLADDSWETYGLPPVESNARITITALGDQLLVGHQTREQQRGGDWLLDPATGAWEGLPADPLGPSRWRSFVADESDLYLFETRRSDDEPALIRGAVLADGTDEWRAIADSEQLSPPTGAVGGVLLHSRLETADGGSVNNWGRSYAYGGIYDPAIDAWRALPNTPAGEYEFAAGVIAAEDQLISHYRNWMLNWETETWHTMPALDGPRAGRDDAWVDGASFGWAGDGLLVVGGVIWDGFDAELRNDAWIWRPRSADVARSDASPTAEPD